MSAAKKLAYHVTVADDKGEQHTFGPDSDVPAWAQKAITNESAWAGSDGEPADSDDGPDEPVAYDDMKIDQLKAEIAARNEGRAEEGQIDVASDARKADVVAALEADDTRSA